MNKEIQEQLAANFPQKAITKREGGGANLSSIKSMYIFERLNQVFGICGSGWKYTHTPIVENDADRITEVSLVYKIGHDVSESGEHVTMWSEPIFAFGGSRVRSGMSEADARKSAVTDGLTKAASMIGVGQAVFKGEQSHNSQPPEQPAQKRERKQTAAAKKADAAPVKKSDDGFGYTENEKFKQKDSTLVEIPGTFKSAPKSGRSLIFIVDGMDVVFPIGHVAGWTDSTFEITDWIAGKKVEEGLLAASFLGPPSGQYASDEEFNEANPPPIDDDGIPF
jgi:hypothetical protein